MLTKRLKTEQHSATVVTAEENYCSCHLRKKCLHDRMRCCHLANKNKTKAHVSGFCFNVGWENKPFSRAKCINRPISKTVGDMSKVTISD